MLYSSVVDYEHYKVYTFSYGQTKGKFFVSFEMIIALQLFLHAFFSTLEKTFVIGIWFFILRILWAQSKKSLKR